MTTVDGGETSLVTPGGGPVGVPALFGRADIDDVRRFYAGDPRCAPTPLRDYAARAASLGIGALWVKDETARFGLNAFKAIGVTYAIAELQRSGTLRPGATLACASEGNHGRALARAARLAGHPARVYVSASIAPARAQAIAGEGATVVRVEGGYDDAVQQVAADAAREGWTVVSDTSWAGYEEIPRLIMLGYTQIVTEAAADWPHPPDVVFVQAGVGGLLYGVAEALAQTVSPRPPVVCAEPASAACVLAAARADAPVALSAPIDTIMAGLRCAQVSPMIWPALRPLVDAYVAIDDRWAEAAVRALASGAGGDPVIEAGPAGACGLGALLAVQQDEAFGAVREMLALGPRSRVLVIASEARHQK